MLQVRILLALLVLLHGLPFILKGLHFWGLDQWRYIPAGWAWAALAAGLVLLLPPVGGLLARPLERLDGFAARQRSKWAGFLIYLALLSASAAAFWFFRNATHFLGDGFLWANHLMKDIVFHEPVSTWLYRGIYRGLNAARVFGEVNPVMSSALTSVLAGLVFVAFVRKTALLMSERRGDYFLFIGSLVSCGMIMLFFGYVETYPPVAAGVMAFIYFSLRWLRRGGSVVPAVAAFLATAVLHLSAVALLPGLLLLLHYKAGKTVEMKRLRNLLLIVIAAGLASLWALQATGTFGGFFREQFLPLFTAPSNQDIAYPLFSLRALFDYANELLLICPLVILLPVLLITGQERGKGTAAVNGSASAGNGEISADNGAASDAPDGPRRERLFLALTALSYFLVFAVFNKVIGTSRDWDLFSPLALPLALWIALLLRERLPGRGSALALMTLAVVVTHTAPWIALNAGLTRSEKRFVDLCDTGYWSNRAKGYGYSTLGQYCRHYERPLEAIFFYGRAAQSDPGNVKYRYYTGEIYSNLGKHGAALEQYFKVLERQGDHLDALNNAGVSYLELGRPAEAEPYFLRALVVDPGFKSAIRNLGYVYFETSRPAEAIELYDRVALTDAGTADYLTDMGLTYLNGPQSGTAKEFLQHVLESRPGDVKVLYGLGMKYLEEGDQGRAMEMLLRAVEIDPAHPQIHVGLAKAYIAAGDIESARRHVDAARSLDPRLPADLLDELRGEKMNPPVD
jgi:tetratricopeptide (TPR) repeat protein